MSEPREQRQGAPSDLRRPDGRARPLLLAAASLFFVSGSAALVLESLWVRLFALSFGTTGLAMATVLTAFMGGLALGGALGGRLADRLETPRRLFRAYAAMELVVALFAVSMPLLRQVAASADGVFDGAFGGSLLALSLGRFVFAAIVLLVPTTLMGATLPVLARAVSAVGEGGCLAERAGTLYAVNTTGAVLGAAATPFVLLPALGLMGTSLAVAGADVAVALLALGAAASRRLGADSPSRGERCVASESPAADPVDDERVNGATAGIALLGIALSGGLAMVYQQAWARALSLVIGSSIYAVSLILALFLAGLAAGSAIYSRRTAGKPGQLANLAVMHLVVALWSMATLRIMDQLPAAFVLALPSLETVTPATVLGLQAALAALVVVPPTFFMGMTFPATLRVVERGRPSLGAGRATGTTYSANTVGAIVGSFVGGFVALPLLGTQVALVVCTIGSVALVVGYSALVFRAAGFRRALPPVIAACVAGALLGVAYRPWNLQALSSGVFRVSRSAELAAALRSMEGEQGAEVEEDPEPLRPWIDHARALLRPGDLWNDGMGPETAPRLLSHRTGLTATVAVTETRAWSLLPGYDWVTYSLRVNGKADASLTVLAGVASDDSTGLSPQGDAETQVLSGLLAGILHPGEPASALVIGWGSGVTAGAALASGLEQVRAVEIEREVLRGSEPFQPHAGFPLRDDRLDVVEDDGRRLLSARGQQYDLIVSEPSNPWITGCSNLFTVEFFRLVESRLAEGGRFLQWVQAYEISPQTTLSILAALAEVFDQVLLFRPAHSPSDLLIVATDDDRRIAWDAAAERIEAPGVARWLTVFGIRGPEDVAARLEADPEEVRRLTAEVTPNSDDNLIVELAAPLDLVRYRASGASRVLSELDVRPPARGALFADPPEDGRARIERAVARLGRQRPPPRVSPSLLAVAGPGVPDRIRRALSRQGSPADLVALAEALGAPEEASLCPALAGDVTDGEDSGCDAETSSARALALLGLSAASAEEPRLAILFVTAHLRRAVADSTPETRAILSAYALESGLPALADELSSEPAP